jgi:cyclic nucleotide gated channel, plant
VQFWNRALLFARAVALAADPVFFYAIGVGVKDGMCHRGLIGVLHWVVALAAAVRTCADMVHAGHIWVQLRLAFVSRESLVVGSGKLVWDPKEIARHYMKNPKGIWFDLFVLLPLPQVITYFSILEFLFFLSFFIYFFYQIYIFFHLQIVRAS